MSERCQEVEDCYLQCVQLCSLEDSRSHLLGSCRHQDMVKSYNARHNEAGKLILKAITKGTSGNNVSIAYLGTHEDMQAMGALDTRLPPWLAQEDHPFLKDCVKTEKIGTDQLTHLVSLPQKTGSR